LNLLDAEVRFRPTADIHARATESTFMAELCEHLRPLYDDALANGCVIGEVSERWSSADFVFLLLPEMPAALRRDVTDPVRYYQSARTPHSDADEGFFCAACRMGLSFPSRGS